MVEAGHGRSPPQGSQVGEVALVHHRLEQRPLGGVEPDGGDPAMHGGGA
jgi:hypothetical protein